MKNALLSFAFALLLFAGGDSLRISTEEVGDNSHSFIQDDSGRSGFYNENIYLKDPKAISVEEFEVEKNNARIMEASGNVKTDVDEDLIRKAEKTADEDLLNGLNAILKNNETLEDVLVEENLDYQP